MVHFSRQDKKTAHFFCIEKVLRIRIRDLGSNAFLTPGSGMEKIRIRGEHPRSFFREFRTVLERYGSYPFVFSCGVGNWHL
jgi:hypothetical protein